MKTSSPTCTQVITPPVLSNQERHTVPKNQGLERPLAEVISQQFLQFDAQNLVVQPFGNEASRDAKFEQGLLCVYNAHICAIEVLNDSIDDFLHEELSEMLLKAILETHAWAAARPKHEATLESQKLEDQISHIMDTEREQGMCSPTPSFPSSFSSSSFTRLKIFGMHLFCLVYSFYFHFLLFFLSVTGSVSLYFLAFDD